MANSQIVVFKLNDQEYGIDIMRVLEIITYQSVRPVPEVPDYIEGIINLRRDIYAIVNLRKRFHMPEEASDENTKIVLMKLEDLKVGFIVDTVSEILVIDERDIEPTPKMIARYDSKYIKGVTKKNESMILLLDIDRLITEDDQDAINTLLA
ncbi:MAG: chemotaxis protein CheW [Cellulosilyticaceae bacterium]